MDISCPIAYGVTDSNKRDIMAGLYKRAEVIKDIKDFTKDTGNLIVIDPYIYRRTKDMEIEKYVAEFSKSANLKNLKKIHIIYNYFDSNNDEEKKIRDGIKKMASGVSFSDKKDITIHDRVWIADREKALVIGSSLNSIGGKKICFILKLPDEDLKELLKYLDDNNLI